MFACSLFDSPCSAATYFGELVSFSVMWLSIHPWVSLPCSGFFLLVAAVATTRLCSSQSLFCWCVCAGVLLGASAVVPMHYGSLINRLHQLLGSSTFARSSLLDLWLGSACHQVLVVLLCSCSFHTPSPNASIIYVAYDCFKFRPGLGFDHCPVF